MQTPFSGKKQNKGRRAAALVAPLVTVGIATLISGAVATVALSNYSRTLADQNSTKALDMAECALNYQLQRIYTNLDKTPVAYNGSNVEYATYGTATWPLPVTDKTVNGGASTLNAYFGLNKNRTPADRCVAWVEYPGDATRAFSLNTSDDIYLYAEASVGGQWRRVRTSAGAGSLFDKWAVFGNSLVDIGGSFSVTPTTGAYRGLVASNTLISIKKPGSVGGQVVYGNATPEPSLPYYWGGPTYELPSIDTLAERAYTKGSYPLNARTGIDKFAGANNSSLNNDNTALGRVSTGKSSTAPLPATGILANGQGFPYYLSSKVSGAPANFYLTRMDGSNATILADVSKGPVNLWVNVGIIIDSQDNAEAIGDVYTDSLQGNVAVLAYESTDSQGNPIPTLQAARKFHIYYNNARGSLSIRGGGSADGIYGMLYAFNRNDDGTPTGWLKVTGSVEVHGTVAANRIEGTGNFNVYYPQAISPIDAGGTYFGLRGGFQELTPVRGN